MPSVTIPLPAQAVFSAVGATSAPFGAMVTTRIVGLSIYMFTSNTACWITQGAAPVATAGAGSMFVSANTPVLLDGSNGAKVAVIQDAVAGKCSLTPMLRV